MPIKDLSDSVRLPRLGKIHLGIKHPEKGYPMKTDYFVFPKDHSDYKELIRVFGEKPKELRILIPLEDDELWASQYYRAYDQTHGLICKGDGENALRMVDIKTEKLPTKDTKTVSLKDFNCEGKSCPDYKAKKCHEVMNLRFLLPEVAGLGVWQIDTGSKNSILNINSCAKIIKKAFGRISLIPLKLTLEPVTVANPEDGKKQTVFVLNLRTNVTLAQLADVAREQAKTLMIDVPDLEAVYEAEVEKDIEELWGNIEKQEEAKEPIEAEFKEVQEAKEPEPEPEAEPATKNENPITEEQASELALAMGKVEGFGMPEFGAYCNKDMKWGITKIGDLKVWQFEDIMEKLKKGLEPESAREQKLL